MTSTPASLLGEAITATRFLVRLPAFLRRPVDRVEARRALERRLARREADFLDLVRRAVYEHLRGGRRRRRALAGVALPRSALHRQLRGVGAALRTAQVAWARRRYRWLAPVYDRLLRGWLEAARVRAVELLALEPGATVLDLGCGTGRSLPLIEAGIGPSGRLIGVDASPDMLARAERRVAAHGWRNVTLIQADAEELTLDERVDAVLCFCTHDILTSPVAVARAVALLGPGGRMVAAGVRRPAVAGGWLRAPGLGVSRLVFSGRGTARDRPWRDLERLLPGTRLVETRRGGAFYLVSGTR